MEVKRENIKLADTLEEENLYDSASAVFSLYKNESIGALSTEELLKSSLVLSESETLTATAATVDRLHVVASYMEIS